MRRLGVALAVAVACGASGQAGVQADPAFELIRDWDASHGGAKTRATADTLELTAGSIWTNRAYADFVLRFEYRPLAAGGRGQLFLRSNTGEDRELETYGVVLDAGPERGRVSGKHQVFHELRFDPAPAVIAPAPWIAVEVRAEEDRLSVAVDGVVVSTVDRTEALFGLIGFEATGRGGLELRGMRIAPLTIAAASSVGEGLDKANGPGVTLPKVTHSVQPRYTRPAMVAKAQGVALLEFVLEADGRIGAVRVIKAPHPDLAVASIACLRKWRFTPASKNGVPIAVVATMELSFKLK